MSTSKPASSIVSKTDVRVAVVTLRQGASGDGTAARCAHALLDSLTAIKIATEAKRRWLECGALTRDEARRMNALITGEHRRVQDVVVQLRTLTA